MVRRIKACRCMDDTWRSTRGAIPCRQGGVTMPGARYRWMGTCLIWAAAFGSSAGRGTVLSADEAPVDAAAVRQYNLAVGLQNKKLYAQAAQKWAAFIEGFPK